LRCTNKPDGITRDLLQALGVGKAFGCILGNTAGLPKKPDPTGIHRVLAGLNAEPTATVMVGDSAIRPMRSAPMPSSTRSTSFPPPLPCLLGGEVILSIYQMFVIARLEPAIWWPPPIFVFTGLTAFAGNDSGRGCK
jgi:phosphoglycolate phosphatase